MTSDEKPQVVVGISGGVDSSVAAWLLKEQGYHVIGLFMKNWEEEDGSEYCSAAEDLSIATDACDLLNIPLKTVNFSYEYWERVFTIFLNEYKNGRTPNPDVLCNKEIKFREFLKFSNNLGAEFIATGHYARVQKNGSTTQLLKAIDSDKDQSYFLYQVPQSALTSTLFPLGNLKKKEVRTQARALNLPNCDRKDSTGICFIGERRFKDFLAKFLPYNPGEIRTPEGAKMGEHDGLWFYTLGQRRGLDIGGPGKAWYVAKKDTSRNILVVVQGHDSPALMQETVQGANAHWISGYAPNKTLIKCTARIRYRQKDQPCQLLNRSSRAVNLRFETAQRAVTPGQSVVLYNGDLVLGGATICASDDANEAAY